MWNMANIKNVVFDFDGTLVDTAPLIVKTMMQTISEMGLPSRTET
ncbi:MAG: HAD hydrolase-like protein, partial [Bacteroides sp.]|nr:HAD hydrolase-like protein [Bacteroides sp.]